MNNEEMQRTMEFIIEQQAQFAATTQRLQEERILDSPRWRWLDRCLGPRRSSGQANGKL